jgi:hypothetical protein
LLEVFPPFPTEDAASSFFSVFFEEFFFLISEGRRASLTNSKVVESSNTSLRAVDELALDDKIT